MIDLHRHSYLISQLLSDLPDDVNVVLSHNINWLNASDWLKLAASVQKVNVDTTIYDSSVLYCNTAWEFEAKRSELLIQLATCLTTFTFIWGGFETVVKVINPPHVAASIKKRASVVDDAIFYLKNNYDHQQSKISFFIETLARLRQLVHQHEVYSYLELEFKEQPFLGISGLGAHIVRIIRNDFAHGSALLPLPIDSDMNQITELDVQHIDLIGVSSRLILLTIQMLLIAFYKNSSFDVLCLDDSEGLPAVTDIHTALRTLHLAQDKPIASQLPLF